MNIFSIRDFADYYLRLWYSDNNGRPESINELMSVDMKSGCGPLMNDITLMFGKYKGFGMWETPRDYRDWLRKQVKRHLQTHSWEKVTIDA